MDNATSQERKREDERLVMRLLNIRQALLSAWSARRRTLKELAGRLPLGLFSPQLGLRLVGDELPRADYTLFARRGGRGLYDRVEFERGFARPVWLVLRFRRQELARLLDDLARQQQRLASQPWRLLRYLPAPLRALRWRTPSGVLTNPGLFLAGILALVIMLFWRFWPYREPE